MKMLGHLWAVVTNCVVLVIIFAMFGVATTRFETVVVAGLTLIYFAVVNTTTELSRQQGSFAQLVGEWLIRIRKLMNDSTTIDDEEELKEAMEGQSAATVRYYINGAFSLLVFIFVAFKLLGVLLKG
jgi:hypothetical protein